MTKKKLEKLARELVAKYEAVESISTQNKDEILVVEIYDRYEVQHFQHFCVPSVETEEAYSKFLGKITKKINEYELTRPTGRRAKK